MSPGDRYVTPPKALWHNYTSVAPKQENGGVREEEWVRGREEKGVEGGREGVALLWESHQCFWLIHRDSPRDASRAPNKAFLRFLNMAARVRSSQLLWASLPSQTFQDASETFLSDIRPFYCWCVKWIIKCHCGQRKADLGVKIADGLMADFHRLE